MNMQDEGAYHRDQPAEDINANGHQNKAASRQRSYIYDLFAVCNHKGQNMVNGHYTAFCKNFIDTRWYCYDDASCIPMADMNQLGNVNLNGANSVCTENAYILFYKRRNCMKNEKWWYNFVDRALYESDEFHRYLNAMDLIERQQQEYQLRVQTTSAKTKPVNTTAVSLVMSNGGNHEYVSVTRARQPITVSSDYNYDQEGSLNNRYAGTYEDMLASHQRQLAQRNQRDAYAYEGLVVNRYDEQVKPHRLIAKSSESPSKTLSRNSPHYQLQTSSTSNLDEAVNSNVQKSRPSIETSKSAHNLQLTKPFITTSNDSSPKTNVLVNVDNSAQRLVSYGMNEFTPSSSSSSSNNDAMGLAVSHMSQAVNSSGTANNRIEQSEESPRELMNFQTESQVQQLFRLNGQTATEATILDNPSENEYLYNQYAYNQPTIKPRTSLNKPTTTTTTSTVTTALPSSNLRYYPTQTVNTRVSNFYGQAAPQYYQYQPTPTTTSSNHSTSGYYTTSTQLVKSPTNRVVNAGHSGSPSGSSNHVNTSTNSASRYINPGSIETTI